MNDKVRGLVEKLVGGKKVEPEPVVVVSKYDDELKKQREEELRRKREEELRKQKEDEKRRLREIELNKKKEEKIRKQREDELNRQKEDLKKLKQTDVKEVYQNIVFKKEISLWTTVAGGMTILFLGLEAFVPACPDYSEKGYTDEWECKYAENPGTETLNSLAWISLIGGGIMWGYYDSELKEYDNLKITYSPKYNSKNLYLVFKF